MVLKSRFLGVIPMALLALALAVPGTAAPDEPAKVHGPGGGANLYGEVADEQGLALPGVKVTLGTGQGSRVAETNAQGQFRFLELPSGPVSVKAELEGFYSQTLSGVPMSAGKNSVIKIRLIVNPEDTITLICEAPLCVKETQ
jgi:hypothetical protein